MPTLPNAHQWSGVTHFKVKEGAPQLISEFYLGMCGYHITLYVPEDDFYLTKPDQICDLLSSMANWLEPEAAPAHTG